MFRNKDSTTFPVWRPWFCELHIHLITSATYLHCCGIKNEIIIAKFSSLQIFKAIQYIAINMYSMVRLAKVGQVDYSNWNIMVNQEENKYVRYTDGITFTSDRLVAHSLAFSYTSVTSLPAFYCKCWSPDHSILSASFRGTSKVAFLRYSTRLYAGIHTGGGATWWRLL